MPKLNVDISKKPLNVVIVAMTALVFLAVFSACLLSARQVCAYAFSSVTSEKSAIETWKPLKAAEKQGDWIYWKKKICYFPVLGGTNPQPEKFAYSSDGINFAEIEKPAGGYTMNDVANYAKQGQLYYKGGSVFAVRSINDVNHFQTWKESTSGEAYPYHYSVPEDKTISKSGKTYKPASSMIYQDESIEKLDFEGDDPPFPFEGKPMDNSPKFNDVPLWLLWNTYSNNTAEGFGGTEGHFWSCVAEGDTLAFYWSCGKGGLWGGYANRARTTGLCALVSKTFK